MTKLSYSELQTCLEQVDLLKKIKEINIMGKKLGLKKFKKTEKTFGREMIVQKLEKLLQETEEVVVQETEEEVEETVVEVVEEDMMMYKTINKMLKKIMNREEDMKNKFDLLDKSNKKLNEEFENLYTKYQLVVSKNDKLETNNMRLKDAVRNLMGDM